MGDLVERLQEWIDSQGITVNPLLVEAADTISSDREKLRRLQAVAKAAAPFTKRPAIERAALDINPLLAALDALLEGDLVDGD